MVLLPDAASATPQGVALRFSWRHCIRILMVSGTMRFWRTPRAVLCLSLRFRASPIIAVEQPCLELPSLKFEVDDSFGVPQYHGDPDRFDEYSEQVWDLWYGRQGAETQDATPVHLRSGLRHDKDAKRKPTDAGIKLVLQPGRVEEERCNIMSCEGSKTSSGSRMCFRVHPYRNTSGP